MRSPTGPLQLKHEQDCISGNAAVTSSDVTLMPRQERSQLACVIDVFERIDELDDLLGPFGAQHRRYQGPRLVIHTLGG